MCGIAGFIKNTELNSVHKMSKILSNSMAHRGPDDSGTEFIKLDNRFLSLVHTRLSIIDISKLGHQPMFDRKNKNWIIFNGEIYNFKKIKQTLIEDGYNFNSNSDTEVLLYAYDNWGVELLDKIEGMFGFALWDHNANELFIAVDPLGIKPIYWSEDNNGFCFSSELRPLIKSGLVKKKINKDSIDNYLAYGSVQGPETIIENLNLLQGGYFIRINSHGKVIEHNKYWNIDFENKTIQNYSKIIDNLESNLSHVVNEHLIADVPIGIFLSGGIDSSALAYIASRKSTSLDTFSVTFAEEKFAEGKYAAETAKSLSINHNELTLSSTDLKKSIKDAIYALDQPSIDGSNVFMISKLVRSKGIKVALSGQGGDEIFGGYSTFFDIPKANKIEKFLSYVPLILRKLMGAIWSLTIDFNRSIPSKIAQFIESKNDIIKNYFLLRQLMPYKTRRKLFPFNAQNKLGISKKNLEIFTNKTKKIDEVDAISYLELNLYLGQTLLRDGDVMGMANGLEIRVPYLDRRILNTIASIPSKFKLDKTRPKPLLLDAVRGGVSKKIWDKKKQGFTFPWEDWLKNDLKYLGDEAFKDESFWKALGFNFKEVKDIWNRFNLHKKDISWVRVWLLIVLREWYIINIQ